jgi:nitrate/TMAO reductase-like tetraheme cytochrome c subunit
VTFPLEGGHAALACARCHNAGTYTGLSSACVSCHQKNYAATSNPNHAAGRFPTTCESCHTIASWRPAKFDHSQTRFQLTGAHTRTDCAKCHVGGRYTGTPQDCNSCHQADYAATTNPNHRASSFPTACQNCHNTSAWRPASFDHQATRFPLTGAHTRVDCTRCHVGGRYTGTPTDCYACHQANYAATTNPNHQAANFPTRCVSCHTTAAWRPASFDHDGRYFPIYSGKHRGKWTSCGECHVNSGNYKAFECVLCHEHSNRTKVDSDHKDERGYAYASSACYQCHRNGSAGDAGFSRRLR